MKKIVFDNNSISFMQRNQDDYISLTDMAKHKNAESTGLVISHWLSTRYAVEFLGIWEQVNNPDFNVTEFSNIRFNAGSNGYVLSAKQWIAGQCPRLCDGKSADLPFKYGITEFSPD